MAINQLRVLREQLAEFIEDHDVIRQFEQLFEYINTLITREVPVPPVPEPGYILDRITVSSVTSLDLSVYLGDLDILADTSGGAFTLTLDNALADKSKLKLHVEDGGTGNDLTLSYTGSGGVVSLLVRADDGGQAYRSNGANLLPISGCFRVYVGSMQFNTAALTWVTILGNTGLSKYGVWDVLLKASTTNHNSERIRLQKEFIGAGPTVYVKAYSNQQDVRLSLNSVTQLLINATIQSEICKIL